MSAINATPPPADVESAHNSAAGAAAAAGTSASASAALRRHRRRRRRRRPRPSAAASSETTTDGSFRFSDTEDESRSLHSQLGGSYEDSRFSTESEGISIISDTKRHGSRRGSCTFSDEEEEETVDLESGELELKVRAHRANKRECRICHLKMSVAGSGNAGGDHINVIELGCSCKGDLGSAHKQCAETWFKIKGNTTCEICGASAINIAGEQSTEVNSGTGIATAASTAPMVFSEHRSYCHSRRVMNFLLACMVFAFIISWLFHFKILP